MDLGIVGNLLGLGSGNKNGDTPTSDAINIPGTLMGNLQNVSQTKSFMKNIARYNNYLTDNYGAAQMASDRYMSLKERIPMSIEYYLTPKQKKEVVLYINPEKINVSTTKLKAKVITRGGIYFHHYGDDVWTMDITGVTGMSQMKGIEALEEVYHHSGALLKYQNITVSTVHTNKITSLTDKKNIGGALGAASSSGLGGLLEDFAGKAKDYINNKVIGTLSDGLGQAGETIAGIFSGGSRDGGGCFGTGTMTDEKKGGSIFEGLFGAAATGAEGNVVGGALTAIGAGIATKGVGDGSFKTNLNGLTSTLGGIMSGYDGGTIGDMAAEMLLGASGLTNNSNSSSILEQLSGDMEGGIDAIASFLNGGTSPYATSNQATAGNFYTLGNMTSQELNKVVKSIQTANKDRQIDHKLAAQNWSDIEDNLTDLYRPRQIFIYFDDRVFIGHFDQFTWTRQASTMSISYTMKFTVTRQVKVERKNVGANTSGKFSLKNVLTGVGVSMLGNALGGIFGGSDKTNVQDASGEVNTDLIRREADRYMRNNLPSRDWLSPPNYSFDNPGVNSSDRNPYRSDSPLSSSGPFF